MVKNQRKGYSSRACYFTQWLKQYAITFGDQLSFGDKQDLEIRLPQAKKKMVWECYRIFWSNDPTHVDRPMKYEEAVSTWKHRADLQNIKCAMYKPGFSKCDTCATYQDDCTKQLTEFEKKELDADFSAHIAEERQEREQYYAACVKAKLFPLRYLSIMTT